MRPACRGTLLPQPLNLRSGSAHAPLRTAGLPGRSTRCPPPRNRHAVRLLSGESRGPRSVHRIVLRVRNRDRGAECKHPFGAMPLQRIPARSRRPCSPGDLFGLRDHIQVDQRRPDLGCPIRPGHRHLYGRAGRSGEPVGQPPRERPRPRDQLATAGLRKHDVSNEDPQPDAREHADRRSEPHRVERPCPPDDRSRPGSPVSAASDRKSVDSAVSKPDPGRDRRPRPERDRA